MRSSDELHPVFRLDTYMFRRKVFRIFGGFFQVYDEYGREVLYSEQARFKIREDFRIYSRDANQELLRITTPHMLDFGATYNVQDSTTGERVGSVRRKFLKSMFKDEWVFLSPEGLEIGKLAESSWLMALISRQIELVPQTYKISGASGILQAVLKQHFNPFILKYTLTITDPEPQIDRRLLLAAGILLAAIERRQQ